MKKLVIELGQVNFDIAENILKNFFLNRENSHRYSFEYDNEDEEEVEAANEFENEISALFVQNNISFKIKREFVTKNAYNIIAEIIEKKVISSKEFVESREVSDLILDSINCNNDEVKNKLPNFLEEEIYDKGGIYYDMSSEDAALYILEFINNKNKSYDKNCKNRKKIFKPSRF